jgi:CRISPR system Cascade subunit CasB
MSRQPTQPHPFITYLETLTANRGVLAALRRGLGQPPGTVAEVYPYILPFIPDSVGPHVEEIYFTIASLFAFYPQGITSGNIGSHMASAVVSESSQAAVERRFTTLLASHPDDLPNALRQAISFLKSKDQPVNWHQLMRDMLAWDHPDRYVQKRWASAFWKPRTGTGSSTLQSETEL